MHSREICDLLKLINKKYDTTILLITHDMDIAMQADEVYRMKDGCLTRYEEFQ